MKLRAISVDELRDDIEQGRALVDDLVSKPDVCQRLIDLALAETPSELRTVLGLCAMHAIHLAELRRRSAGEGVAGG